MPDDDCDTCPPRRDGKRRSVVFAALACAHCTLTAAAAVLTVALAGAPVVFGVRLEYVVPPFLFLGLFGAWLWTGRLPSTRSTETRS